MPESAVRSPSMGSEKLCRIVLGVRFRLGRGLFGAAADAKDGESHPRIGGRVFCCLFGAFCSEVPFHFDVCGLCGAEFNDDPRVSPRERGLRFHLR